MNENAILKRLEGIRDMIKDHPEMTQTLEISVMHLIRDIETGREQIEPRRAVGR